MGKTVLTADHLRETLRYDPETGEFFRLTSYGNHQIGDVVRGRLDKDGYVRIKIGRGEYGAHRLAFLYMKGRWPTPKADHQDLNKTNNRWVNIREASHQQSAANRSKQVINKSGLKGVHWAKDTGKWCAQIADNGKSRHLGFFDCAAAANLTYQIAADIAYGSFSRGI